MAQTLALFDRIKMQELVDVLSTFNTFADVTEDALKEQLCDYALQGVNDIREDCKDLYIDDYVFTIRPLTNANEERVGVSGLKCNNIFLSDYVEVWVTDTYGYEMQFDGDIIDKDGELFLHLSLDID